MGLAVLFATCGIVVLGFLTWFGQILGANKFRDSIKIL